jgi:hypothetical protein
VSSKQLEIALNCKESTMLPTFISICKFHEYVIGNMEKREHCRNGGNPIFINTYYLGMTMSVAVQSAKITNYPALCWSVKCHTPSYRVSLKKGGLANSTFVVIFL